MSRRKHKSLPVFIEEDHNEVLPFIYRNIGSRHLPLEGNTMIHFDSHPDLLVDHKLNASDASQKERLFASLSIENWILPGCFTGQFSKVWWVKPHWSNQITNGKYDVVIGQQDDKIRVGTDLYYFLSDGIFVDQAELQNARNFELVVSTLDKNYTPDEENGALSDSGNVILDIDLDFFSTKNPFSEQFAAGNLYEKLKPIFTCPPLATEDRYNQSIILAKKRRQQLERLQLIFEHLEYHGTLDDFDKDMPGELVDQVRNIVDVVNAKYDINTFDWTILYNAGLTCDESELPHHVTKRDELLSLVENFKNFLIGYKIQPIIVTVARSSDDDYCPREQVEEIQSLVINVLKDVYGDLDIQYSYKNK